MRVRVVALTTDDVVHLHCLLPSELWTLSGAQGVFLFCIYALLREDSGVSSLFAFFVRCTWSDGGRADRITHHLALCLSLSLLRLVLFTPPLAQLSPISPLSLISLFPSRTAGPLQDLASATHSQSLPPTIYIYLSTWRP